MANQICPTCKNEMRWQPAGISQRTGQHYNGFWSCPNRCPKPQRQSNRNGQFEQVIDYKSGKIQEAQDRKELSIAIAGAKSAAGEIVAAMIKAGELSSKDYQLKFAEVANWVYNFTPKKVNEPIDINISQEDYNPSYL